MNRLVNENGVLLAEKRDLTFVEYLEIIDETEAREPDPKKFAPTRLSVLAKGPPPPIPWMVDGLLIRGRVTLLAASMKVGKSIAALSLGADLALIKAARKFGTEDDPITWLGQRVSGVASVLYMTAEGGDLLVHQRAFKMLNQDEIEHAEHLHVYAKRPTPQLGSEKDMEDLRATIRELKIDCLIIDPLGRFWTPEDEAKALEAQILFDRLADLAEELDIAILIIHHDGKSVPQETTGGRGSGKLGDCADILINLKRDGEDGIKMTVLSRWGDPPPVRYFQIRKEDLRLVEMDEEDVKPQGYDDFIHALRKAGGWVTRGQIALATGMSEATVRRYIPEWVEYGLAEVQQSTDKATGGTSRAHVWRLTRDVI